MVYMKELKEIKAVMFGKISIQKNFEVKKNRNIIFIKISKNKLVKVYFNQIFII